MEGKKSDTKQVSWKTIIRSPLALISRGKDKYTSNKALNKLIEHVADTVDPSIKNIRGYRARLRPALLRCQLHCKNIVAQIPGPIIIGTRDISSNSWLNAVFPDQSVIPSILREADALQISANEKDEQRVALLTMTHNEREFFGTAREGQMVIADARLESVTFTDHKIVGIATTLDDSRHLLENIIFDVIIEAASHEISIHKVDLGELKAQREKLKAMLSLFGKQITRAESLEGDAGEKIHKVKTLLKETEDNLSAVRANVEMPEDRLDFLIDYLSQPENVMDIQLVSLRLDWRNVKTQNPEEPANTLEFAQCTIHQTVKRDAVLISYSIDSMTPH